jgi:GAF domain-containing protein
MEQTDDLLPTLESFGAVARQLGDRRDVDATVRLIVTLAVEHLEHCEAAAISLVQRGTIISSVATDPRAERLDRIQVEVREGPCIDTIAEHEVFTTGDVQRDQRWPRFAARAHSETGIRSIASLRLFRNDETMGALNLYATQADAFDDTDVALAMVFAAHAAMALSGAQREAQLELKAATRDLIGRAKGILMATKGVDDEEAFSMLRATSMRLNVKLTEVAERITDSTGARSEAR